MVSTPVNLVQKTLNILRDGPPRNLWLALLGGGFLTQENLGNFWQRLIAEGKGVEEEFIKRLRAGLERMRNLPLPALSLFKIRRTSSRPD